MSDYWEKRQAEIDKVALSEIEIAAVIQRVTKWLEIKIQNESDRNRQGSLSRTMRDAEHSSLLPRLLSGKKALPERPQTYMSQPVYPEDS